MTHVPPIPAPVTPRRRAARAAALLGLIAVACAASATAAEKIKMHRSGAGTPGPDGWLEATSSGGSFSVRLPCRFNDLTATPGSGDVVRADVLGCVGDGVKFGATRVQYRDAALAGTYFEGFAAAGALPGASLDRAPYRDHPTITRQLDTGSTCTLVRIVHGTQDNILMTVEAAPAHCSSARKMGMQFLDSLVPGTPSTDDTADTAGTGTGTVATAAAVGAPTLSECPLDAELAGAQAVAAFGALPRDVEEKMPSDTCKPATTASMIMRRDGICTIGGQPMTFASLMTLEATGAPVSMMFMTAYRDDTHAALQAALEQRYRTQPASTYPRYAPAHRQPTSIVSQPGGTLLLLGRSPPETSGEAMTSVFQFAPASADLVNRSTTTCR
ncbi:hypothetical protein ACTUVK_001093 [Stenotrophomonas rhizophila]